MTVETKVDIRWSRRMPWYWPFSQVDTDHQEKNDHIGVFMLGKNDVLRILDTHSFNLSLKNTITYYKTAFEFSTLLHNYRRTFLSYHPVNFPSVTDVEAATRLVDMQQPVSDTTAPTEDIPGAAIQLCRHIYFNNLSGVESILAKAPAPQIEKILRYPLQKLRIRKSYVYNYPLGYCMEIGSFEICKYLIDILEPTIFTQNSLGNEYRFTAIHCAAINPDTQIFELLISSGIVTNINIQTELYGNTPLHYACYYNDKSGAKMVDLLIKNGAHHDKQNSDCELPLHWAALGGNVETFDAIFKIYEEKDIKQNAENLKEARNAVLEKRKNNCSEEQLNEEARNIVERKNKKKFGEDCLKREATKLGVPLLFAAKNQHFDCMARILDLQIEADGTCRDDECDTALHFVSRTANPEQIAKILKANALLGAKNEVGNTPLDWISPETMEEVLDNHIQRIDKHVTKSDVSTKDQYEILFTNLFGHHASGSDIKNILALASSKRHQELALHPVCQSVLSAKWQKMKKYFLIKLLFFIPFIVLLSVYPVLLNDLEYLPATNETSSSFDSLQEQISITWYSLYFLLGVQVIFGTLSVVVLISPFLNETRALMTQFNKKRILRLLEYYYTELLWSDWYEYIVWVLAFLLLHDQISPIPVVVSSWFCLFIVCSCHPSILPFRYILVKILFRYVKFLIFAFGLISGFAMGFYLLLRKCSSDEGKPCVDGAFENIYSTALKIPAMMMGEISFEAFSLDHAFPHVYFLFGGFIFLITCCLFNMMNGLAINITQEMMLKAHIFKTIAECDMIYEFEVLLKEVTGWITWFGFKEIKFLAPLWVERIKASPSSGKCKNLDEILYPANNKIETEDFPSNNKFETEDLWETNKQEKAKWRWVDRGYVLDRKIIYEANAKILDILEKEKEKSRAKNVIYKDPAENESSDEDDSPPPKSLFNSESKISSEVSSEKPVMKSVEFLKTPDDGVSEDEDINPLPATAQQKSLVKYNISL